MPFTIPVQCTFPRFFHSYKVGFYPEVKGGTVLKELSPKSSFTLTPQDASGNDITVTKSLLYIRKQMYFEAKKPEHAAAPTGAMRMYINKCFMTASQDYTSTPKYTVIDNFGWKELYGDDSPPAVKPPAPLQVLRRVTTRNMVSSHSWKVDLNKRDGKVDVHPRMKFLDADTFTLEDPSMAAHKDYLQHWDMTIKTNMGHYMVQFLFFSQQPLFMLLHAQCGEIVPILNPGVLPWIYIS
ncbi:hypothetical protein NQZ68_018209 [Dissostichus eleginoides]|nr:hypothetical protein NQZ68_018209 [Dissostichus eleginoides]